jgi:hypothetical protein
MIFISKYRRYAVHINGTRFAFNEGMYQSKSTDESNLLKNDPRCGVEYEQDSTSSSKSADKPPKSKKAGER